MPSEGDLEGNLSARPRDPARQRAGSYPPGDGAGRATFRLSHLKLIRPRFFGTGAFFFGIRGRSCRLPPPAAEVTLPPRVARGTWPASNAPPTVFAPEVT